eukprot:scaffold18711_cov119-Isochrysis_galbana.AAC.8
MRMPVFPTDLPRNSSPQSPRQARPPWPRRAPRPPAAALVRSAVSAGQPPPAHPSGRGSPPAAEPTRRNAG